MGPGRTVEDLYGISFDLQYSSDLEGHELRFAYGLGDLGNIVARRYLVDAISSDQDGNRFRLDYNVKF